VQNSEAVEVAVAEARGQCGNPDEREHQPLEVVKPLPNNDSDHVIAGISVTENCLDPFTNPSSFYIHYPLLQFFFLKPLLIVSFRA
jgi:hypothetical protein